MVSVARLAAALAIIAAPAWAQSSTPTATELALAEVVRQNDPSSPRDYWISTINVFGDKETVGLIFGMADNLAFCDEVMQVYRERYPRNRFFCEPAN